MWLRKKINEKYSLKTKFVVIDILKNKNVCSDSNLTNDNAANVREFQNKWIE